MANRLFAIAKTNLIQSNAKTGSHSPNYSNNTYIQFTGASLGTSRNVADKVLFNSSVASKIAEMLNDTKPTIVYIKK